MGKIVLCADTESLLRPWMIGLDGIDLESVDWLVTLTKGDEIRCHVKSSMDTDEVWVVSTDDVDAVNVAAAVRKDRPTLPVLMVMTEATGSAMSCAKAAGVTKIIAAKDFGRRFGMEMNRRKRMEEAAGLGDALTPRFASNGASIAQQEMSRQQVASQQASTASSPQFVHAEILPGSPRQTQPLCADQTVPYPVPIEDMRTAASDKGVWAGQPRSRNADAFLMSVVSGSGGSGKSALSAMAACSAVAQGFNTLLLDCDLQFGDLKYLFGMLNAPTIDDALSDPTYVSRLSAESHKQGVPALLVAPARIESSESLAAHISTLVDEACDHFDAIIVNTGATWSDLHADLLEKSTYSVFLIDQRAASVHGCKHAMDLCLRMGIATGTFLYALNRCDRNAMFSVTDIASIMRDAHIIELKEGGQEVEELLGAGLALELVASKNDFVRSVDDLMGDLLQPFEGRKGASPVRMARRQDNIFAIGAPSTGGILGVDASAFGIPGGPPSFAFGVQEPREVAGKGAFFFGLGSRARRRSRRRGAGKHASPAALQGAGGASSVGVGR